MARGLRLPFLLRLGLTHHDGHTPIFWGAWGGESASGSARKKSDTMGKKTKSSDKHLFEKGRVAIATNGNQKHEVKSFHNASQIPLPFHYL